MPIPLYLAMTAAEFLHCTAPPRQIGWMACHFSSYGTGLSNLPTQLPEGSLLILNDRTPVCGHDPQRIADEISKTAESLGCSGILLDLQRPGNAQTRDIVKVIGRSTPCPVGVSQDYWDESLHCAVFLAPPPLHIPLSEYLSPWQQQTVWLEVAMDTADYILTETGCNILTSHADPDTLPHRDAHAFCRYGITVEADSIRFTLHRGKSELELLQRSAQSISLLIGLYQEWK